MYESGYLLAPIIGDVKFTVMKITDYGIASLHAALGSWLIGVTFTLMSWWTVSLVYENNQPGDPKPESLLLEIFPILAFLAFPGNIIQGDVGQGRLFILINTCQDKRFRYFM